MTTTPKTGHDPTGHALARPDLYVVARFLEVLWLRNKPLKPTQLQMAVGLNYTVFRKYLAWFAAKGLVAITDADRPARPARTVTITARGVQAYKNMMDWLEEFIGA